MAAKVLVLESDVAFAGELETELERLGFSTRVVEDGNAGLQAAANDRPDLILLSIELPKMNGFSVCNKLKKDPALKDVPLIIMSSESTDETFEQHKKLRTRADDYVHKPIAFADLMGHIRQHVNLEAAGATPGDDSMIVIDDDLLIEEGDGANGEAASEAEPISLSSAAVEDDNSAMLESASPPSVHPVDAEVEAFANKAFDRLLDDGSSPPGQIVGQDAPTMPGLHARTASAPSPPDRTPADLGDPFPSGSAAGAGSAAGDSPDAGAGESEASMRESHAELRSSERPQDADILHLEEEVRARDQQIERAQLQIEQLRREVDTLKRAQPAAGGGAAKAGVSSREFLDLRETVNKKDKEILALRDQVSRREKELLDASDAALVLEREKADQSDRISETENKLAEVEATVETLRADKEQAVKRADDFKQRIDKLKADLEGKLAEVTEVRQKQSDEIAARLREIADLRTEIQVSREREAEERRASLGAARREAEDERIAAVTAREAEVRQELDATYTARENELKGQQERKLGSVRTELESRLASERAQLEGKIAQLSQDLAAEREALAAETERSRAAASRWEANRKALDLAKDALAAALSHVEEVESRG